MALVDRHVCAGRTGLASHFRLSFYLALNVLKGGLFQPGSLLRDIRDKKKR